MKTLQPLHKLVLLSIIGLTMMLPIYDVYAVTDPVAAPQENTFGAHRETVEDMSVKILGDDLRHTRSWNNGTWYFNRRWEPLRIELKDSTKADDANIIIHRAATKYEYKSNGIYAHETLSSETIVKTETGYRWQDRKGNWIDYSALRATQYGDRNNLIITLQYDALNRLTGTFDPNNKQIYWYEYDLNGQLSLVKDYSGRKVEYKYTERQLTEVIDVLGNSSTYTYLNNQLATKTDAEGRITTIDYTATGLVKSIDNAGVTVKVELSFDKTKGIFHRSEIYSNGKSVYKLYNRAGDFIGKTVNDVVINNIEYSNNDLVRTTIDQAGNRTTKTYDQWNNVLSVTYPDNSKTTTTYEYVFGQPVKEVNENGVITLKGYDSRGNLIKLTEAAGLPEQRITNYSYDAQGNQLSKTIEADEVSVAVTTSATYDEYGNQLTTTDGEGHVTTYTYDVLGKVLTRKNSLNKIWTFTYTKNDKKLSATDPLNHTTSYQYDKVGNLIKITDALNRVTRYEYDDRNNRTAEITALNQKITYKYNNEDKLIQVTDASNKSNFIAYNIDGMPVEETDGNGNVTQFEYVKAGINGAGEMGKTTYLTAHYDVLTYDKRGRIIQRKQHLDASTVLTTNTGYDAIGNRILAKDAEGRQTQYVYDVHSRLIEIIDPAGGSIKYAYDNRDNLIGVTNANGGVYQYQFDKNNQKTTEIKPLGEQTQYVYNVAGQLISEIDANNHKRVSIYDDAGRNTDIESYAQSADADPVKTVSFAYNESNNLITHSDSVTSAAYEYDELSRPTKTTINFGSFIKDYSYSYDASGNMASFTGADGVTINYSYDSANLLTAIKIPSIGQLNYVDYQWMQPKTVTLPDGATQNYTFDPMMRITGINLKDPAQNSVLSYGYGYDNANNITSKQTEHGDYQYGYDELDRLTTVDNPTLNDEAYTYDALGNRLTDAAQTGNWEYNLNNQLTSIDTSTTYGYDNHGSMVNVSKPGMVRALIYNTDNRLSEVKENNTSIASYSYDVFGRRVSKTIAGQTAYYLYSNEGLIAEMDNSGNITKQYGWQPNNSWGTDPVYLRNNADIYFYQNDHLGTPQKLISRSGSIVWSSHYKSFGEADVLTQAVINNLRFPGQYYDGETELHYNYFRDYDSGLGRYVESDPIGIEGGINIYLYADAVPTRKFDPNGLSAATRRLLCDLFPRACGDNSAGNCTRPQHRYLQKQVDKKCKQSGKSKCNSSQSCSDMAANANANMKCAGARMNINNTCFNGGDDTHRNQVKERLRATQNCVDLFVKKDCGCKT